jgi:hypothetical protein
LVSFSPWRERQRIGGLGPGNLSSISMCDNEDLIVLLAFRFAGHAGSFS